METEYQNIQKRKIKSVSKAPDKSKSLKTRMSLYLTSKKTTKGFDGDLIIDTHQSHISHQQFHKITNTILETTVNENKMRWQLQKALSHRDVNNKPMVSGLSLVSSDKFSI